MLYQAATWTGLKMMMQEADAMRLLFFSGWARQPV
jgi:hypothetical protein